MKLHRNWTMSLPLVLALSAGMSGFCAAPQESAGKKEENVPPPPGERRPGPSPRGRNPHAVFFSKLTQEERAEIDKLARANDHAGLRQKMRELFQEKLAGVKAELEKAGFKVSTRLSVGNPRAELITLARSADVSLIVLGSHGKGRAEGILWGSVSRNVAEYSDRPTLVIKG